MLCRINNSCFAKPVALFLLFSFLSELFFPSCSFALTSGPSQPEATGFHSANNYQLVDPFTGKFSYNIPILSVGDYPINLSYNSNVTMDQEASWVGLGWNMNIGQITRNMRGLPDDFNGDLVSKEFNMADNITVGGLIGGDIEIAGLEKLKAIKLKGGQSIDLKYNNYTGISLGKTISAGIGVGVGGKCGSLGLMGSASLSTGSEGLTIQPNLSFSAMANSKDGNVSGNLSVGYGISVNSRSGLQQRTLSASLGSNITNPVSMSYGTNALFGPVTFTPQIQFPFTTNAIAISIKGGTKLKPVELSAKISGYFSKQKLNFNSTTNQAYGYYYLENGQKSKQALLDFNREKDATFIPGCPNLPLTYLTYDIFQIGAQGIDGTFRAYRNKTGYVFDPKVTSGSASTSAGVEVNVGSLVKAGVDITEVEVNSKSTSWEENNLAKGALSFSKQTENDPLLHVYFKKIGDLANGINAGYYAGSGGNKPVKFQLEGGSSDLEIGCKNIYERDGGPITIDGNSKKLDQPAASASTFQCLTVEQVNLSGDHNKKYLSASQTKNHHIGQIKVYSEEGKRYVFGLPAYNNLQKEVSFSSKGNPDSDHLITYSGPDNSKGNKNGLDHFYSATSIPHFVYAWYLTDVLSPDYVDLTGDGPSPDDYGNYVKFHSSKKISGYKWRTPFQTKKAQFDEQLLSLSGATGDDKGHYIYGNRDVWYVDTITSKTQIAVFHTSPRKDAFESNDENGGPGPRSLYKIDSISLYNVHDYEMLKDEAYPQVRVHFVYDYSMCQGIPNNPSGGGKLTLRELFFTYGSSYKGKHNGYTFSYGFSQPYSMVNYDRWGIYKAYNPGLPNFYFPYSIQNKTQRDNDVSTWLLNKIELPSGGFIQVNYESDDYNYVQDKKAMRMFKVVGAASSPSPASLSNELYGNSYLFFDLEENSGSPGEAMSAMTKMINYEISENLYFKFKVNVEKNYNGAKDFVFGYCKMATAGDFGIAPSGNGYKGWIKVKDVPVDDQGSELVNPISRAAMQFCRLNTPKYAFNQVTPQNLESDPVTALKSLLKNSSIIDQLVKFAQGPNGSLKAKEIGNFFDQAQSWIRLNNPGTKKLGGGARVKKLTFSNNWNAMQGNEPFQQQVQEYIYELENGFSSGVASYEPLMGGDEIPQHLPVSFSSEVTPALPPWARTLAPHDSYLKEEPFGEMAFPSAEIGYSRVLVKNMVPPDSPSKGTGFTLYEFFTAKDFPVITTRTPITAERRKWQSKFTIFKKKNKDYMNVSQGYYIELNNMHGKPKRTANYNASGSLVNESKSEYFTPGEEIKVLRADGKIAIDTLGLEEDMVADFREHETITETGSSHVNLGAFLIGIIPVIIPLLYPVKEMEHLRFRSATTTRVIYKYGILKKQIVSDLGAKVETENLVFNPVTGSPVLTRINNQYLDPVYSFSYPADDIFRGMASSGFNLNTLCKIITNTDGKISSSGSFFAGGDELLDLTSKVFYWVRESGGNKYLIKKDGHPAANINGQRMLLFRSGHRNLIGNSAGQISCLENPLVNDIGNTWKLQFTDSSKIINASATTFSEGYRERCFRLPANENCLISPMGKAMENLFNKLLDSYCNFFSAQPVILHSYGSNSQATTDTLLVNYFNPDNIVGPLVFLKWKMNLIAPGVFQANIYLENEGVQSQLCKINFSFSCQLNKSVLKAIMCKKSLVIQSDANCNAFSTFQFRNVPNSCNSSALVMGIGSDCFPFFTNSGLPGYQCGTTSDTIDNPYRHNLLGAWYPEKQYAMIADRVPSSLSSTTNLRSDGYYESFSPFWKNVNYTWEADTGNWTRSNTLTITDPDGKSLEAQDALQRFSATLLGYNNQLPIATAVNAMYREVGSENFEDYYPGFQYQIPQSNTCYHFKFADYYNNLALDTAHTGYYSMRVSPQLRINMERPITGLLTCKTGSTNQQPFTISPCNCSGIFSPVKGTNTKFVLSYWQKSEKYPDKFSYSLQQLKPVKPIIENEALKIKPEIQLDNSVIPLNLIYASNEIDGWVKEEYEFIVPIDASSTIKFSFFNPGKSADNNILYLDDIRVHPFDATMKTFVYDPFSHRLMATLDENNFAVIYQYDEEGNLQEIIHETERGRVWSEYYKKELGLK